MRPGQRLWTPNNASVPGKDVAPRRASLRSRAIPALLHSRARSARAVRHAFKFQWEEPSLLPSPVLHPGGVARVRQRHDLAATISPPSTLQQQSEMQRSIQHSPVAFRQPIFALQRIAPMLVERKVVERKVVAREAYPSPGVLRVGTESGARRGSRSAEARGSALSPRLHTSHLTKLQPCACLLHRIWEVSTYSPRYIGA